MWSHLNAEERIGGLASFRKYRAPVNVINDLDASIFVYRDPFERCVSLFKNKFIHEKGTEGIQASFEGTIGCSVHEATFMIFLDYLSQDFEKIDPHSWPQSAHLADVNYTHVIEISKLSGATRSLFPNKEDHRHFQKKCNSSSMPTARTVEGELVDVKVKQLSTLCEEGIGVFFDNFRTQETLELVKSIYTSDYEMLEFIERNRE
jgi:hypothetical protein